MRNRYKMVAKTPPSDSDVLKITFGIVDKTVHFFLNGKEVSKMVWEPPAGVKFFAHVAIQSNSQADPAPKNGGKPYTGNPNDSKFVSGAICAMRGDDSWQVDGAAWLFNAFVLLAGCAYLVGGIAMGKRAGAKPAGPAGGVRILAAARLHPHWAVWEQTAGLAKDGVLFILARSGVRLGSGMHTPLLEAAVPPPPPPADDDDGGRSGGSRERERRSKGKSKGRRSKDGKSGGKDGKSGRSRSSAADAGGDSADPQPPAAAAAVDPAAAVEWRPTPRSHLSSGARETGVKIQL